MTTLEKAAVTALPWLSAAGSAAMTGITVMTWKNLSPADRVAFGLDAVAYAVAARPLAHRRSTGWWTLYLATLVQPVFAVVDIAQDSPRWGAAIGRTAGAALTAALLHRLRRNYA